MVKIERGTLCELTIMESLSRCKQNGQKQCLEGVMSELVPKKHNYAEYWETQAKSVTTLKLKIIW